MREKKNSRRRPAGGRGAEAGVKKVRRRKFCNFCVNKEEMIDYKDINKIKRFVTDRGKILPQRATGTCATHQRKLSTAVKRARHIGLLPFTVE